MIRLRREGRQTVPVRILFALPLLLIAATTLTSTPAAADPFQVYLLAGQSNMVGYGTSSQLPPELQEPQTDVRFSTGGRWGPLRPGYGTNPASFGPEITYGRDMADALPDQNIALIKYAVGGTSLATNWRPPDENGENAGPLYETFMTRIDSALGLLSAEGEWEVAGMLWMQGERDARELETAQAYEQNLTNFIASIRDDVGVADLPFVIGQISDSPVFPYNAIVRQAQYNVSQTVPNTGLVITLDLPRLPDNVHYNTQGTMMLGSRFAAEMLTIPEPTGLAGAGLLALLLRRRQLPLAG
jgi:iduronate 2-sulfatase